MWEETDEQFRDFAHEEFAADADEARAYEKKEEARLQACRWSGCFFCSCGTGRTTSSPWTGSRWTGLRATASGTRCWSTSARAACSPRNSLQDESSVSRIQRGSPRGGALGESKPAARTSPRVSPGSGGRSAQPAAPAQPAEPAVTMKQVRRQDAQEAGSSPAAAAPRWPEGLEAKRFVRRRAEGTTPPRRLGSEARRRLQRRRPGPAARRRIRFPGRHRVAPTLRVPPWGGGEKGYVAPASRTLSGSSSRGKAGTPWHCRSPRGSHPVGSDASGRRHPESGPFATGVPHAQRFPA